MARKLAAGHDFPDTTLRLVGDGEVTLPGGLETPFGVVLFYRGHW